MADAVETATKAGANAAKNVPPAVWIGAVVLGLGVSFYLSRNKRSGSSTEDMSPQTLVYTGVAGGAPTGTVDVDSGSGGVKTNEEWGRRAKSALLALGYGAVDVNRAVDGFLQGTQLTVKQNALINEAIQKVGPPPMTLPPTTGPEEPGGGGGTAPLGTPENPVPHSAKYGQAPQGEPYVVKEGDSLASIAKTAYGITDGAYAQVLEGSTAIYNANWYKISDAKNLVPGTTIYVPVMSSLEFQSQGDRVGKIPLGKGARPGDEEKEWAFQAGIVPKETAYYGSGERLGY